MTEKEYNQVIYPWKIVREIGHGSGGSVYEICDTSHEEENRALKVISFPDDNDEIKIRLQQGESADKLKCLYGANARDAMEHAEILQKLGNIPNIVTVYKVISEQMSDGIGWHIFMFMELLKPLDDLIRRSSGLPAEQVIKLGTDICNALHACHEIRMLHRDVKPGNILLDNEGNFKLADFGIVKIKEKTTANLSLRGTEHYIAPEIIKGSVIKSNCFNADIFSLGIIMFQLLNEGRMPSYPDYPTPLSMADEKVFFQGCVKGEFNSVMKTEEGKLSDIVMRACSPDPFIRHRTADELKADLNRLEPGDVSGFLKDDEQRDDEDCCEIIEFGRYPQTRVELTEDELEKLPESEKKSIHTDFGVSYRVEPIRWRVLNSDKESITLMSDSIIDSMEFNSACCDTEWKTSTIRSWLNGYTDDENEFGEDYSPGSFMSEAFTPEEREELIPTLRTDDSVFLLSAGDVYGKMAEFLYGFRKMRCEPDFRRIAKPTDYAVDREVYSASSSDGSKSALWWLRSSGLEKSRAAFVDTNGRVALNGASVYYARVGVRPVIRIKRHTNKG